MRPPLPSGSPTLAAPSFYLTGRQTLGPGAVLLATLLAVGALFAVLYGLKHSARAMLAEDARGAARSTDSTASVPGDEKDDPNQVDTIVLGDPADAPVPVRRGDHVSPVHATIVVHLPRFGEQTGLIPDSAAGRLLYGWLAAFNQANYSALGDALPSPAPEAVAAAQRQLRRESGGYSLLSAREAEPGVLVFRLRDQTPAGGETLGTLQVVPGSSPAAIASFSLRVLGSPGQDKPVADSPVRGESR